jgi:hypothetical protein
MQKALRIIVAFNVLSSVALLLGTGSAAPLLKPSWLSNAIGDWWVCSTLILVFIFLFLAAKKVRRQAVPLFWLDTSLFSLWVSAFIVMLFIASAGFAGF